MVFAISFFTTAGNVFASTTDGTIDPTYRYAWGENVGFVDFGSTAGNVHITDSALSGSIYGENIGWIDLSTITNNNEGILSGYAWGENIGWVDFSKVAIGTDGVFSGSIYGENIGWITFGTGDNKVMTDWRPLSVRPVVVGNSGLGVYAPPAIISIIPEIPVPVTEIAGCENRNTGFSITTGMSCVGNTVTTVTTVTANSPANLPQANPEPLAYNFGTKTLKNGSQGDAVKELQRFLNDKLNLGLVLDGIIGPKTIAVIKKWQKENDLVADGLVGPLTKAKMNYQLTNY